MTDWTQQQQAEHRATLCEALRSGRYPRTTGALRRSYKKKHIYCVFGVACDVSGLGEWVRGRLSSIDSYIVDSTDAPSGYPPTAVTDYYGLNPIEHILIGMNDNNETTFEELADFIEDQEQS